MAPGLAGMRCDGAGGTPEIVGDALAGEVVRVAVAHDRVLGDCPAPATRGTVQTERIGVDAHGVRAASKPERECLPRAGRPLSRSTAPRPVLRFNRRPMTSTPSSSTEGARRTPACALLYNAGVPRRRDRRRCRGCRRRALGAGAARLGALARRCLAMVRARGPVVALSREGTSPGHRTGRVARTLGRPGSRPAAPTRSRVAHVAPPPAGCAAARFGRPRAGRAPSVARRLEAAGARGLDSLGPGAIVDYAGSRESWTTSTGRGLA